MRKYLLALAMLATVASVIALAGVNTDVFACGNGGCHKDAQAVDEALPAWAVCNVNLDCLRF